MSIIGKGYFINSNSAVIHVVAPSNSTITAKHYDNNFQVDKTMIKTEGKPRVNRTWVSDYYFRINEDFYGTWKLTGVSSANETLRYAMEHKEGISNETYSLQINQKGEYNCSCYLNTPILEYDDLQYINTNGYSDSFSWDKIVLEGQNSLIDILTINDNYNNRRLYLSYNNNKYSVTVNSSVTDTLTTGKICFDMRTIIDHNIVILSKGANLKGITTTSTQVYDVNNVSTVVGYLDASEEVNISDIRHINTTDYYFVWYSAIVGLIPVKRINITNGSIISTDIINQDTQTLGGNTYFYGATKQGRGDTCFYPVRRLSDNKVGIVHQYYKQDTLSADYYETFTFITEEQQQYIAGPIRTQRETWIVS